MTEQPSIIQNLSRLPKSTQIPDVNTYQSRYQFYYPIYKMYQHASSPNNGQILYFYTCLCSNLYNSLFSTSQQESVSLLTSYIIGLIIGQASRQNFQQSVNQSSHKPLSQCLKFGTINKLGWMVTWGEDGAVLCIVGY